MLKTLCADNLVKLIKNLPPLIRDDVIGETTKVIKLEAEEKVKKKIRSSAIIVEDLIENIIESRKNGTYWRRPEYTNDIDDEIYNIFVDIAERTVERYQSFLIFGDEERY
jgi:hypothetical protein